MNDDKRMPTNRVEGAMMAGPTASDFEYLKLILDGYNNANRHSNRLWATCAIMTILIISAGLGDDSITLFGSELERDYFIPIATLTLSLVNIAYCVAHAAAYRVGQVYHSLIDERFSQFNITSEHGWRDAAHRIALSNFNRIYPLLNIIENRYGKVWYRRAKFVSDCLFSSIPIFGIIFGIFASTSWFLIITLPFALVSCLVSVFLFGQISDWIRRIV